MTNYQPKIGATDFLKRILRFTPYMPYNSDFEDNETYRELDEFGKHISDRQKDKEIQMQQLKILAKIFIPELPDGSSLDDIIKIVKSGEFMYKRQQNRYNSLIIEMEYFMSMNSHTIRYWKENLDEEDLCIDLNGILFSYRQCLKYCLQLYDLLDFNAGVKESSYNFFHGQLMTNYTSKSIDTKYIYDYLSKIIDPECRKFTIEELKEKYNYPENFKYPRHN